jgi:hypothetical protein
MKRGWGNETLIFPRAYSDKEVLPLGDSYINSETGTIGSLRRFLLRSPRTVSILRSASNRSEAGFAGRVLHSHFRMVRFRKGLSKRFVRVPTKSSIKSS